MEQIETYKKQRNGCNKIYPVFSDKFTDMLSTSNKSEKDKVKQNNYAYN